MTDTVILNSKQRALKTAIVAVQYEEPADLSKFGLLFDEEDEVKVLLIGGNSLKYRVPKGDGAKEKARIEKELGW